MKHFKIETYSLHNAPQSVINLVDSLRAKSVSRNEIDALDSDIEFIVCDLREAHGNLNKYGKNAWLSPRNNDNTWNVSVSF